MQFSNYSSWKIVKEKSRKKKVILPIIDLTISFVQLDEKIRYT